MEQRTPQTPAQSRTARGIPGFVQLLAGLATVFACVFACIALVPQLSLFLDQERNKTANATATASADAALARQVRQDKAASSRATAERRIAKPQIQPGLYVGYSPSLTDERDLAQLERAGLKARLLTSLFRDAADKSYAENQDSEQRYLFLIFQNIGDVTAYEVTEETELSPKTAKSPPIMADYRGAFGPVKSDQNVVYALLVDRAEGMAASDPLAASSFQSICVTLRFRNEFGTEFSDRWCVSESDDTSNIISKRASPSGTPFLPYPMHVPPGGNLFGSP